MSSHHIVREKQEPALLVLSLDDFDLEWLGQLLEWSPTVITTAAMAEVLAINEIKIDVIVGNAQDVQQADIKYIDADAGHEEMVALNYLVSEGYPSVNVITDALKLDAFRHFVKNINLVVYCGTKKVMCVRSGYSKWAPAGQSVEILEQPHSFLYTGLNNVNSNTYLTAAEGIYSLSFDNDYIFIAEQL